MRVVPSGGFTTHLRVQGERCILAASSSKQPHTTGWARWRSHQIPLAHDFVGTYNHSASADTSGADRFIHFGFRARCTGFCIGLVLHGASRGPEGSPRGGGGGRGGMYRKSTRNWQQMSAGGPSQLRSTLLLLHHCPITSFLECGEKCFLHMAVHWCFRWGLMLNTLHCLP